MAVSNIPYPVPDTGWITLSNSNPFIAYRKIGKEVCVRALQGLPEQGKWKQVGQLPTGYRPVGTSYFSGVYGAWGMYHMSVMIDAEGHISISAPSTATSADGGFYAVFAVS